MKEEYVNRNPINMKNKIQPQSLNDLTEKEKQP